MHRQPIIFFKFTILFIWLVLFGLLLRRDVFIPTIDPREASTLAQAAREEYQGIYFQERKIGYVVNTYSPGEDRRLAIEQQARMTLNVADSPHTIDLHLKALLGVDGGLQDFNFSFQSPFYSMQAEGRVDGSRVNFTLTTGSATIHDSLQLSSPPMLSTSRRAYLLKKDLKVGEKTRIPWFDPLSLTGKDSVIEYRGKERILIHGRVQNLHHFIEIAAGARVNSWLDDNGEVIKEESPAGFVFVKEAKFKALAGSEKGPELLSAVSAKIIGSMPPLGDLKQMNYRLHLAEDHEFKLNSGRQKYSGGLLTLDLESLPDPSVTGTSPCRQIDADLAATPSVQSDHPKIRQLAARIVSGKTTDLAKARALAGYVFSHLEKRPVLGLPDALTTLDSGRGDCNEHAVLFAALARAAGIPCRIAAGVVFFKEAFYYHAWNEVCLDGRWISLDTTTDQLPADLSHIKFIEGEIKEQMRIGSLLGQLAIEPLAVLPPPAAAENAAGQSRKEPLQPPSSQTDKGTSP